jgi:hypothetical protein
MTFPFFIKNITDTLLSKNMQGYNPLLKDFVVYTDNFISMHKKRIEVYIK